MPLTSWPMVIAPPQDGEPANEEVTKRAHEALAQRTDYLRQSLEDYSTKNGRVTIKNAHLNDNVVLGDVVYYDPDTDSYGQAIAEGVLDNTTSTYVATKRAYAIGVCVRRPSGQNTGEILCSGSSDLMGDFSIAPDSLFDQSSGYSPLGTRAYLSSFAPGKLSSRPVSPLIQIGMLSDKMSFISPLQKDVFESHIHYRFGMYMKPASSQNHDGSGVRIKEGVAYVDYCNNPSAMPDLVMSIRRAYSGTAYEELNPTRIEIKREVAPLPGGEYKMAVKVVYSVDAEDPDSVGAGSEFFLLDWPAWGEYVSIPASNLMVSFYSHTANYDTPLPVAVGTMILDTDTFRVCLPFDLDGWTNANRADRSTPVNSFYRYVMETDPSLESVWPPTPLESTIIETNGVHRLRGVEYIATNNGVYWIAEWSPWFWDYDSNIPIDFYMKSGSAASMKSVTDGLNGRLYFSKTSLENSRSVVLSLTSVTPSLLVRDCMTGEVASTGHLNIDMDLSLANDPNAGRFATGLIGYERAAQRFRRTTVVSELIAGVGINIQKSNSQVPDDVVGVNCGRLVISRSDTKFEGTIDIVSLINAKEDLVDDVVPAIYFLPTSRGRCRMVSRVKVPNEDFPPGSVISLSLFPTIFGDVNTSAALTGIFTVTNHIVATGTNIGSIAASPSSTSSMNVVFSTYIGKTLLPELAVPIDGGPGSPIVPGCQVYTVWERSNDSYPANIGFSQVRWKIDIN